MYNNREKYNEGMVDVKERNEYEYGDYTARNEYATDAKTGVDTVGDLNNLLYYSSREADSLKSTAVPAPKAKNYQDTMDDSTPSITTMQFRSRNGSAIREELPIDRNIYTYELENAKPDGDEDKQYRISTKGKVLIAVYALVVATIFALIVLNTKLLNNMNSEVALMQNRIQTLKEEQAVLSQELDFVSSDAEIERKAMEMGMTK